MGNLYVVGDTHQSVDIHKLNSRLFPIGNELTKDDILVILGDAGFVWSYGKEAKGEEKFWRDWIESKPWTTFCVLGNHENYDAIEELPIVEFGGAPARQLSKSVFYAETGTIYNLCGAKCLVMNGADSTDIVVDGEQYRKEGISWWRQEQITQEDVNKGLIALARSNDKVDFVFSHTGGTEVCKQLGYKSYPSDFMLDQILYTVEYSDNENISDNAPRHYCGHYHRDKRIDNTRIVYNDILLIYGGDEIDRGSICNITEDRWKYEER